MRLLGRRIGLVTWRGLLGQVRVGGPLGVDMKREVPVLRVADLEIQVGEQIDARDGPVKGGSPGVETAVPAGPKTSRPRERPVGTERDRCFQLATELAKTT